jgi:uncharacterized peroxidase-related enzyme
MAQAIVESEAPGIVGLMQRYPHAARPLSALAEAILRGPSPLTPAERELIATYVSSLNRCAFCTASHAAVAGHLLGDRGTVDAVVADPSTAVVSDRLRALLAVAARVQAGGRVLEEGPAEAARACGATEQEIHDTVLIAAAFCMYNRYVDGMATPVPERPDAYEQMGAHLAVHGYAS